LGDQWILADAETVEVKGTPVIVLEHMIQSTKTMVAVLTDPESLNITDKEMQQVYAI
jgi:hypothetical protein